ncbi:hypothetical protein [Agrococcus jejuensis]|uniref:Uncharacterized protein n=1 Tax=Agrococcus jejuensis TaxID=399736 RepID=A0A1G8H4F9_9MICO|nr:hypothetical protein [Agrococcus jejuensis]SDI01496.1 hypothetical protein SAMN04489720_3209 [Agrococcus jejuensis]
MAGKPPLLKGRGFQLIGAGIGLVVGVGAVVIVQFASGWHLEPLLVVIAIVVTVVGAGVGVLVGLLVGRRAFGQRLEVAMRPAGERRWQHGHIEVAPGRLRFHRYRWQVRFVLGDPVDFAVTAVGPDLGRRPSKRQLLTVNPSLHIIDVETDRGTMELGLQAHQVDAVRRSLQPDDATHGREVR